MRRFCCVLVLLLAGCIEDFPSFQSANPGADMSDRGVDQLIRDAMVDQRRPDPDDGVPPVDAMTTDDMRIEPDLPPGGCRIRADRGRVVLRTWNAESASDQLAIESDCEAIDVEVPPWLDGRLDGQALSLTVDAQRGVRDGEIVLRAQNADPLSIPVRAIGLTANPGTRRALIYVVDGFKGDTLESSRSPAMDWLAKHATRRWDGVPHRPTDMASRASGWASLLTGLSRLDHGFDAAQRLRVPSFKDRVSLAFAAQWRVISEAIERPVVEDAADVIAQTVTAIEGESALVIAGVDGLLDVAPGDLREANTRIDADLDTLLAAIARRPIEEDWLIVVTAATSGTDNSPDLPVVYAAPTQEPVMIDAVSLMDVHTSVLRWLGVLRPGWDLPGEQLLGGAEAVCDDGIDNDGDGRVDCRDADCAADCQLGCDDVDIRSQTGAGLVLRSLDGTIERRPPCDGGDPSTDLVVRWVAPRTGQYVFSTHGSAFDTVIEGLRQQCGPADADPAICNDDYYGIRGQAEPAAGVANFAEGESAFFFLGGYEQPRPDQEARLSIVHTQTACENAPELRPDNSIRTDNRDRLLSIPPLPDQLEEECQRQTAQRLFRWSATPGTWLLRTSQDPALTISLWRGMCDDLQPVDCVRGPLARIRVQNPTEYLVVVSSIWNNDDGGAVGPIEVGLAREEE